MYLQKYGLANMDIKNNNILPILKDWLQIFIKSGGKNE